MGATAKNEIERIRAVYTGRRAHVPADRYSLTNLGHLFLVQQLERQFIQLMAQSGLQPLSDKKLLEVGCGSGFWLREFIRWGAQPQNLTGVDLLPDRIEEATLLCPSGVSLRCGDAGRLEFPSESFDIVFGFTIFTSILDIELKKRVASEMRRVTKPGGCILWYDFHRNNPRNRDVRGIKAAEIRAMFPDADVELHSATLAPPIARAFAPRTWMLAELLERMHIANSHYLGLIRPRTRSAVEVMPLA